MEAILLDKKKLENLNDAEIKKVYFMINKKYNKKNKKKHVDFLHEELKKIYNKLNKNKKDDKKGGGFLDTIKKPFQNIYNAFTPITSLNNISTETMNNYGSWMAMKITVARTPLNQMLENSINLISFGQFEELKKQFGFDSLFHLSLIVYLSSGEGFKNVVVEKNEVVNIEPLDKNNSTNKNTQYLNINIPYNTNLNIIIQNTRKMMGDNKFFTYNAFNNNCQNFVYSVLKSNALLTKEAGQFILQDVSGIEKELNRKGFSYVPSIMHKITNIGSIVSRLTGRGTKEECMQEFKKYLESKNIHHTNLNHINYEFINFINSRGLKFL
jgi:hypothetical protein